MMYQKSALKLKDIFWHIHILVGSTRFIGKYLCPKILYSEKVLISSSMKKNNININFALYDTTNFIVILYTSMTNKNEIFTPKFVF